MPVYDMYCNKCNKTEEIILKLDDYNKNIPCPTCGEIMTRCIGNKGGFILKGGGWFKDGYSDKSNA